MKINRVYPTGSRWREVCTGLVVGGGGEDCGLNKNLADFGNSEHSKGTTRKGWKFMGHKDH